MLMPAAVKTLNDLCKEVDALCEICKTASRNGKSLTGDNFYGNKFHASVLAIERMDAKLRPFLLGAGFDGKLDEYAATLDAVRKPAVKITRRSEASRKLKALCHAKIIPHLEALGTTPVPTTEQVLPMSVVAGTRGYLENVIVQANGCYEHHLFDACAVMIRKFVEILIIETFEHHGKAADIQGRDGNFFMLRDLVDRVLTDAAWNLGRETKKALPLIKTMGDRSAHNRRYLAKKPDVDAILPGLRVIADELLHLARLK